MGIFAKFIKKVLTNDLNISTLEMNSINIPFSKKKLSEALLWRSDFYVDRSSTSSWRSS